MASFGSTFFGKTIHSHLKYDGNRGGLIGPALANITGCAFLAIPLWTALMQRSSKRVVSLSGTALGVGGYALFYLADGQHGVMFATLAILGVSAGAAYLTF